jgi:hypothetical protein
MHLEYEPQRARERPFGVVYYIFSPSPRPRASYCRSPDLVPFRARLSCLAVRAFYSFIYFLTSWEPHVWRQADANIGLATNCPRSRALFLFSDSCFLSSSRMRILFYSRTRIHALFARRAYTFILRGVHNTPLYL